MIKRYIKITHNNDEQHYIETRENIMNAMSGELDGFLESGEIGDSINLTIFEMEESEYEKLPEFMGW
jgi:peptide subunit release factor RF-3